MPKELKDITDDFAEYTGTEHYYKHVLTGVTYTDGVRAVATKLNAYWLIDAICSYMRKESFQAWILTVINKTGLLEMREDDGKPVLVQQQFKYTDFPEGTMKMYLIDGTLILPSEY